MPNMQRTYALPPLVRLRASSAACASSQPKLTLPCFRPLDSSAPQIGCRIANTMRPHVNKCHGRPNSMSTERIDHWDYSIPPGDPRSEYPITGKRPAKREIRPTPTAPQQTRTTTNKPARIVVPDNKPSAQDRYRAFEKEKREKEDRQADEVAKRSVSVPLTVSKPASSLSSLSFKKKAPPPSGSVSTKQEPPADPAPAPSSARQLHDPVSFLASGSSYPRQLQDRFGGPPIRANHQPQQPDYDRPPPVRSDPPLSRPARAPSLDRQPSPGLGSDVNPIDALTPTRASSVAVKPQWNPFAGPSYGHHQPYAPPPPPIVPMQPEVRQSMERATQTDIGSGLPPIQKRPYVAPGKSILRRRTPPPPDSGSSSSADADPASIAPAERPPSSSSSSSDHEATSNDAVPPFPGQHSVTSDEPPPPAPAPVPIRAPYVRPTDPRKAAAAAREQKAAKRAREEDDDDDERAEESSKVPKFQPGFEVWLGDERQ